MGAAGSGIAAAQVDTGDNLGPLTEIERKVLEFVERAALQDRELEPKDEMAHQLGFSGTGTIRGIMLRLERKGYIKTVCFQRGRKVYATRLDKWTRAPMCVVPHWRTVLDRSRDSTPTLPVTKLLEFPTVMAEVNRLQRERNLTFQDAQIVLMTYGVSMLGFERAQTGDYAHG